MSGAESAAGLDALAELLLAAGAPVSSGEIARRLNWCPSEVAAAASGLAALGAELGGGAQTPMLRLADPLARERIAADLGRLPPVAVEVRRVCESTNDRVRHGPGWRLCVAEAQTAGRGRRGAGWHQPFGAGLALSLGAPVSLRRADGLAIALAVAVAEALADMDYRGIGLKWPNDLYADGGKLGGLLVEAQGGPDPRLIVGVGLNVSAAPAVPGRRTAALAGLGPVPARNRLAAALARALIHAIEEFAGSGFAAFAARFAALDMLSGCRVRLEEADSIVEGVARGVGADGGIVVETIGGRLERSAGQVTVTAWQRR